MPGWLCVAFILFGAVAVLGAAALILPGIYYRRDILRVIEDLPVYPRTVDEELTEGEAVRFTSADGIPLAGRYMHSRRPTRRGVVIFSHEFGATGDSAARYVGGLLDRGFDLFTFDYRGHGRSGNSPGYEPRQWPSNFELTDLTAAVDYVTSRDDASPAGVGIVGISRGAGAAISAAARDPRVQVVVADGAFSPRETIIAYVKKWAAIYVTVRLIGRRVPMWFCLYVYVLLIWWTWRRWGTRFLPVGRDIRRVAPRPLTMVHGENDTYIPVALSEQLFARAGEPKEHWVIPSARHNQGYLAGQGEYVDRIAAAFERGLRPDSWRVTPDSNAEPVGRSAAEAG